MLHNLIYNHNIIIILLYSLYIIGINKPIPTFIKLNPAIPDLSIPELQERIRIEESTTHQQFTKPGLFFLVLYSCLNFHNVYYINSVAKGKLPCGYCENCLLKSDCGKCKMCLDKKKFGGPGKKKQRCMMRKCKNIKSQRPALKDGKF